MLSVTVTDSGGARLPFVRAVCVRQCAFSGVDNMSVIGTWMTDEFQCILAISRVVTCCLKSRPVIACAEFGLPMNRAALSSVMQYSHRVLLRPVPVLSN